MKTRTLAPFLAVALAPALLAQITPGNLVVVRAGDGAAALGSAANVINYEEFTLAGAPVQTIPLVGVTISGSATSEGFLTQSADGNYLIGVGYAAAVGTASVNGTTSATVARVVVRLGLDGSIDTSTALGDAHSGGSIRSAVSYDGTQFWTAGAGSGTSPGVRYATLGGTTSTQLSTSVTNVRHVNIYGEQLYVSSASGTFQGVSAVGTGLPTTSGETITLLPGFPTATGPSSYDFFFADADTLYVADDRTNGNGGLQKWVQSAGTWTLLYTLAPAANVGCRSVTGTVEGGLVTLYATTTQTSANSLVTVLDAGAGSPFTTLVAAPANTAFRGVQFVRTPSAIAYLGTPGCPTSVGVPTIGIAGGLPVAGNANFRFAAGNCPDPTLVIFCVQLSPVITPPLGFPLGGAPACALLHVFPDQLTIEVALGGVATTPAPIPNSYSLAGFQAGAQALVADFSFPLPLPVGTTDALQVVVGN